MLLNLLCAAKGSALCARCDDGYAMSDKQCRVCNAPSAVYLIISLILVFSWFPALRQLLTQYMKSLYTSIAFTQAMGIYASFGIPHSSGLKSLFRGLGLFNLNLDAVQLACVAGGGGMIFKDMWLIRMLLPAFGPVGFFSHFLA